MKKSKILLLAVSASVMVVSLYAARHHSNDANKITAFIKDNPEKAAILLVKNDEVIVSHNQNKMMPLASTMKIIIAIEYAHQAAKGIVDAKEWIPISDLDAYYAPYTDGNAHSAWLNSVDGLMENQKIPLHEVVKGMILYSSNANTDWLMKKLGVEQINKRIETLELQNHSPIYPIVAALFVSKTLAEDGKANSSNDIMGLTDEEYSTLCIDIHQKMNQNPDYSKNLGALTMDYQRVWSDRLPASTVADYVALMTKLNAKTYFAKEVDFYLSDIMEYIMKNPANSQWLKHCGMKGGSSAFVLTKAVYASLKNGDRIELAYFFNDLDLTENMQLQMSMNDFELKILSDDSFIEQMRSMF